MADRQSELVTTDRHEKLVFKFSFANKHINEQSPSRALSVSADSSCECRSNQGEEVTPTKLPDHEPTFKNEKTETPKIKD
jgi:hypothetical protein